MVILRNMIYFCVASELCQVWTRKCPNTKDSAVPSSTQWWCDLSVPQQDRVVPSSVQRRRNSTALDEPTVYSPRSSYEETMKGKGMSGLLAT
jgi:hypothetical protein